MLSQDKMRFGLKFLILLSFSCIHCNGTSPEKVATSANPSVLYRYTDQEDQLIFDELSRLSCHDHQLTSKSLWEHVAEKHHQKWAQKTSGFPQERSDEGLRQHFLNMVRHPRKNKKVPDNLWRKFGLDLNKSARGDRRRYTKEEKSFIIEELSKPSYAKVYASSTFDALLAKHNLMRQSKAHGFENERSILSLRSRVYKMHKYGKLPDKVVKKITKDGEDASTSEQTTSNQQAGVEVTNEECDSEDERAKGKTAKFHK